jgi:hypothetical protein
MPHARTFGVALLCAVLGLTGLALPAWASAAPRIQGRIPAPWVNAGAVDVLAPAKGTRTVLVPITLSAVATTTVRVRYQVVAGTAVLGRDVADSSGVVKIPAGRIEGMATVTVLDDPTAPTTSCWFQATALGCRTFHVALSVLAGHAVASAAQSDDAIAWPLTSAPGVGVGDAFLVDARIGPSLAIEFPVTLSAPQRSPVTVQYRVMSGSAVIGIDVDGSRGSLRIPPGTDASELSVAVPAALGHEPDEVLYLELTSASGATIIRKLGTGIIATSAKGVANPLGPGYAAATLTQVVSLAHPAGDTYRVDGPGGVSQLAANGVIVGANDRVAFWPRHEVAAVDEESCATWSSQVPAQGPGVITQEGLTLRLATHDGVTRAITITKNVYGPRSDPSSNFILDVLLWNTSHTTQWRKIDDVVIAGYLDASHDTKLPWNVCARVVGSTLQVEMWLPGQAPPAWTNDAQGGTFQLPAGWDFAGVAGWYVGHLATGATATYTNEYDGPPEAAPALERAAQ